MKSRLGIILGFLMLAATAVAQVSPTWSSSPYIKAQSYEIVGGNQKTSGTYTNSINFGSPFPTPTLTLSIPQLRIVSNGNAMDFKCTYSALNLNGFTHTLLIVSSNTVIWYLTFRYLVVSLQLLPNQFEGSFYDGNPIINAGAGTVRTETFNCNSPLTISRNLAQSPTCVPFVTGVTATSVDYYQLNVTCSITASTTATVSVTVHPNTLVSSLTVHMFVYDSVALAVTSVYFVDYTITSSYQGVQKVFMSLPKGYFDTNFIGGFASFSIVNNVEFNVTLAIPSNNTFYTPTTSLYDTVPQAQIRLRLCPAAFPYYNKIDGLCYSACPSTTYPDTSAFVCYSCPSNCLTCLNTTVCTLCIPTMTVSLGVCVCPTTTYAYNGNCYGCDHSCQTCYMTGQYYNCLSCNATNHRSTLTPTPPYNNTCPCDSGYEDVGVAMCEDICGDGQALSSACDDGNTVSGDGCSSTCTIEDYFSCVKDVSLFSTCYFVANLTMQVVQTLKYQYSNVVQFIVLVKPWIPLMSQLATPATLTSNGTFLTETCDVVYDDHDPDVFYMRYTVSYSQPLENTYLRIDLKPATSGTFSIMPPANVTVKCVGSNAHYLYVYTDRQYAFAERFSYACLIFGYFILATSVLFLFGKLKWLGNMLFLSLQFQYLSLALDGHFTPMMSALSDLKKVMGFNKVKSTHFLDVTRYGAFFDLEYMKDFLFNVNFMVSLQVLGIVMYAIYKIVYIRNQKMCMKYGKNPEKYFVNTKLGKFLNFFNWEFFMFWTLFNMTNQILSTVLASQQTQNAQNFILIVFCMVFIVLALLPLFFKRKDVPSYTSILYYKQRGREEQMVTLVTFVAMYLLYYFQLALNFIVFYVLLIIPLLPIAYLFLRKPFRSNWWRAAYFVNFICIFLVLVFNRLQMAYGQSSFYLPFGPFFIILFDWLFNVVVWVHEMYVSCKNDDEQEISEKSESNSKSARSRDDSYMQEYFKPYNNDRNRNPSLLAKIFKANEGSNKKQTPNTQRFKPQNDELTKSKIVEDQENSQRQQDKKRKKSDEIDSDEDEKNTIKRKRKQWEKEMREMRQIKELRERTRQNVSNSKDDMQASRRLIRTTDQRGIEPSRIKQVEGGTIRYM